MGVPRRGIRKETDLGEKIRRNASHMFGDDQDFLELLPGHETTNYSFSVTVRPLRDLAALLFFSRTWISFVQIDK